MSHVHRVQEVTSDSATLLRCIHLVLVLLTCGEHIIILIVNILALVLGEGESGAQEGS